MRVQTVKVKKFKVLENFEADIKGNNVFLVGENGLGKSSLINAIKIALGDQSHIPPSGEGEWTVVTTKENGTYQFRVKLKDGKAVVEVTSPDGLKDSRKGTIAALTGAMSFDIDEFLKLSDSKAGQKKQVEIYKSFFDAEIIKELDKYAVNVKALESQRTEIGRDRDRLKSVIESSTLKNEIDLTKFKEVDTAVLLDSLNKANTKNETIKGVVTATAEKLSNANKCDASIKELEEKIALLKEQKEGFLADHKKGSEWLKESKNQPIDTTDIQTQINDASDTNKKAAIAKQLQADREAYALAVEEYGTATANIESQRESISIAIKEMDTPVEGLSFNDDTLVYNGIEVSLSTLSTSEIMELGILMKIAENKELGILFLEHGESLGAKRLKDIQEIAAKNNMQLIIEQVERGKEKLTIEIMEG